MATEATLDALPARVTAVEGRASALEARASATEEHVTILRVKDAHTDEQLSGLHQSIERLAGAMDKVFWALVGIPFAAGASFAAAVLSHIIHIG